MRAVFLLLCLIVLPVSVQAEFATADTCQNSENCFADGCCHEPFNNNCVQCPEDDWCVGGTSFPCFGLSTNANNANTGDQLGATSPEACMVSCGDVCLGNRPPNSVTPNAHWSGDATNGSWNVAECQISCSSFLPNGCVLVDSNANADCDTGTWDYTDCKCRDGNNQILGFNGANWVVVQCAPGEYLDEHYQCQPCSEGYYCDGISKTKCPLGSKSNAGAASKNNCYIDRDTEFCDNNGCFKLPISGQQIYFNSSQPSLTGNGQ